MLPQYILYYIIPLVLSHVITITPHHSIHTVPLSSRPNYQSPLPTASLLDLCYHYPMASPAITESITREKALNRRFVRDMRSAVNRLITFQRQLELFDKDPMLHGFADSSGEVYFLTVLDSLCKIPFPRGGEVVNQGLLPAPRQWLIKIQRYPRAFQENGVRQGSRQIAYLPR